MPHIESIAKRKKVVPSEVIEIAASPAPSIGIVYATDERNALEAAIEEFKIISPRQQKKLMVRRQ
jgi:hypothetical protein